MLSIAVLASTKGTSLQPVIDEIKAGTLPVNLACVISNKEDCYALERTRAAGFEAIFIDREGKKRAEYDREIDKILEEKGVELIVLVGYMRLFSPWFVEKYRNRIINVHPSLLPSFRGMDLEVHQAVLDYGCKVTGCTFFFVDEGKDAGPIICQKCVEVAEDDTAETLKPKVQELEKKWFPEVIGWYAKGKIEVEGRRVRIKK